MMSIMSLRAFTNWWSNPLDHMPSGTAGIYPLPVEIWQHIFSLLEETPQNSSVLKYDFYHFFSPEDEAQFCDPYVSLDPGLLYTKRSIIQVCRSWYFIGIPALWSHLSFKGKDPYRAALGAYSALRRDPSLGSYVNRLTIVLYFPRPAQPGVPSIIIKMLSLLPNLSVISCPQDLAEIFPESLQPKTTIIHTDTPSFYNIRRPADNGLFWNHSRILSLTVILGSGAWTTSHIFPNLTDLRIFLFYHETIQWDLLAWSLPVLQNLSITIRYYYKIRPGTSSVRWTRFLERNWLTLQRLQISALIWKSYAGDKIEMPLLKELQLLNLYDAIQFSETPLYEEILAPKLQKFVLYTTINSSDKFDRRSALISTIGHIQRRYPSLKEICVIAREGAWHDSHFPSQDKLVITTKDIEGWCFHNLTVTITSGMEEVAKVFTQETFLQDEYTFSERFYVPIPTDE